MIKIIKLITGISFFVSIASICYGFLTENEYSQKCIGFGVVGLFFIVFPLFSYYRWKNKNVKDYMLTKESLEAMRKKQKENNF